MKALFMFKWNVNGGMSKYDNMMVKVGEGGMPKYDGWWQKTLQNVWRNILMIPNCRDYSLGQEGGRFDQMGTQEEHVFSNKLGAARLSICNKARIDFTKTEIF